jgi:signal peptidase II
LLVVTIFSLGLLIYLFQKNNENILRSSIIVIIAGALGNFFDRLLKNGEVVDYLLFKFGNYSYPAFNIADMLIVIGTGLFIISMLIDYRSQEKIKKDKGIKKCY